MEQARNREAFSNGETRSIGNYMAKSEGVKDTQMAAQCFLWSYYVVWAKVLRFHCRINASYRTVA